ncbi:MAG: DUF952 domain-containing protein [Deltaproteobacteria bacterium]|nr:DUF952 domain-containing protein [Deltaproteobacteria bacterium]
MSQLFHIVARDQWGPAKASGTYAPPSLESEGFIHLSARHQVAGTAARFYAGVPGLVLLEVDEAALGDKLVWEEGEPGVQFPHLYRALRAAEVLAVHELEAWLAG